MRKLWLLVLLLGLVAVAAAPAGAAYPEKPIQLIVPYAAGGSTDVLARAVTQVTPKYFPQPVMVVNKPGGGAIPGRLDVVKSRPDGYTLLFGYGSGEDYIVPHQRTVPYDVFKDFEPICRLSVHSVVLAVPASSPYKTLADLVKAGKAKDMIASVSTKGGIVDITLQLFAKAAGFKLTTVPGAGGADAITSMVGGHVDFGAGHPSEVLPHMKAGRLRGLAVAFEKWDPAVADVPTFKEQGYDIVTAGSVKGIAAPKATPKEIVGYLEKKFKEVADDSDFQKIMKDIGQPVLYMTAAEYAPWLKATYDQAGTLIKTLGIEIK
jgi:tripartite-type tricarboxylate transporter receptor subunit TctC